MFWNVTLVDNIYRFLSQQVMSAAWKVLHCLYDWLQGQSLSLQFSSNSSTWRGPQTVSQYLALIFSDCILRLISQTDTKDSPVASFMCDWCPLLIFTDDSTWSLLDIQNRQVSLILGVLTVANRPSLSLLPGSVLELVAWRHCEQAALNCQIWCRCLERQCSPAG